MRERDDDPFLDDVDDADTDNVGDASVEINVEDLLAEISADESPDAARPSSARRRLEDMLEEKRVSRDLADYDDFDAD